MVVLNPLFIGGTINQLNLFVMEKKTAIVVISSTQFDVDAILKKNNDSRLAWFSQLVDEDCTIHDLDSVLVFDNIEDFCGDYNCGGVRGFNDFLVAIEYTDKIDGKFVNRISSNTPTVSQVEPIKVENIKLVDADTLSAQINEELEEAESTPKYNGEFIGHIEEIWREGHKTILVELSGEKYVINGLFDNDDVIIDCYVADTMQRIDRYFIVGAQQKSHDEAECYCEYFLERIAKDRNINECWFLTERQFKFLKEA